MKKSKRITSMILAVIMLSMTAIGVNAHDELPAEKIDTTEIAVESVETEATGDSELLEEVEPSVSEIEMQSNESETEVEAKEEELQPQRASRAVATCDGAYGFSGAWFSFVEYFSGTTTISNGVSSTTTEDDASSFIQEIYTMKNIWQSLSEDQAIIWLNVRGSSVVLSTISNIISAVPGDTAALFSYLVSLIQIEIENSLKNSDDNDAEEMAGIFTSWYASEQRAENIYIALS